MSDGGNVSRKADYGIDAGFLLPLGAIVGVAIVVVAAMSGAVAPLVGASVSLCFIGSGLHSSLRGKFLVWQELLDGLHLKGDERLLDLGCGRGAVLCAAARRLPRGLGVGVDIW